MTLGGPQAEGKGIEPLDHVSGHLFSKQARLTNIRLPSLFDLKELYTPMKHTKKKKKKGGLKLDLDTGGEVVTVGEHLQKFSEWFKKREKANVPHDQDDCK